VGSILHWVGVAAQYSPDCPAHGTYLAAIDGEITDFLSWYEPRLEGVTSPDFGTFVDLKQELLRCWDVATQAYSLGLPAAAAHVENQAVIPTLGKMREIAYALGRDDGWHFALNKLTTFGFFSGRSILGIADPRVCDTSLNPPRCYVPPSQYGPFTNADIYEDLQFCGTDITVNARVASGGTLANAAAGGGGSPGVKTDAIVIDCPTRGTVEVGGRIATMTCFTTGEEADDKIVFALDGTDVLTILRPLGDDYLQGTPAAIDIMTAAAEAGITPKEGASHELALRRKRTHCSDDLWGPVEYTLLRATLNWKNPTLEVEVQMPDQVQPGEVVNVDVRVKVIDQLGQASFFDAIDIVLQSSGGLLSQLQGETDAQGYFRTTMTVDNNVLAAAAARGATLQGVVVNATATSFEGVTAQGSKSATVVTGAYAEALERRCHVFAYASAGNNTDAKGDDSSVDYPFSDYGNTVSAAASGADGEGNPESGAGSASLNATYSFSTGAALAGWSASGSATATKTGGGSADGVVIAHVIIRVVNGSVNYSYSGSLTGFDLETADATIDRWTGGGWEYPPLFSAENQGFSTSGVLTPGTYRISAHCESAPGFSPSSLDVDFQITQP
jgi:hypothetical protein